MGKLDKTAMVEELIAAEQAGMQYVCTNRTFTEVELTALRLNTRNSSEVILREEQVCRREQDRYIVRCRKPANITDTIRLGTVVLVRGKNGAIGVMTVIAMAPMEHGREFVNNNIMGVVDTESAKYAEEHRATNLKLVTAYNKVASVAKDLTSQFSRSDIERLIGLLEDEQIAKNAPEVD